MHVPTWLYFLVCVGLLIGNVNVYQEIFAEPVLTVSVLPVEKGTPVLIQGPSGKTVLVDTGTDASILRALGSALPMWRRRLDAVVLTSSAKSASGALPDVQNRYRVSTLIRSAYRGERFSLHDGAFID